MSSRNDQIFEKKNPIVNLDLNSRFMLFLQVTQHLFRKPGSPFGRDLAAINIARAREHGVPSYTRFRELCGLPVPQNWDDFTREMNVNVTTLEYSTIFELVFQYFQIF